MRAPRRPVLAALVVAASRASPVVPRPPRRARSSMRSRSRDPTRERADRGHLQEAPGRQPLSPGAQGGRWCRRPRRHGVVNAHRQRHLRQHGRQHLGHQDTGRHRPEPRGALPGPAHPVAGQEGRQPSAIAAPPRTSSAPRATQRPASGGPDTVVMVLDILGATKPLAEARGKPSRRSKASRRSSTRPKRALGRHDAGRGSSPDEPCRSALIAGTGAELT